MPDARRGSQHDHVLMTDTRTPTVALRPATAEDGHVLQALAALDSTRPLRMPALLGLVDGAPRAAVSLVDGRAVADPFVHTADVVALLRARAAVLRAGRSHGRRRRVPTRRLRFA
jgi:hypothetical protein